VVLGPGPGDHHQGRLRTLIDGGLPVDLAGTGPGPAGMQLLKAGGSAPTVIWIPSDGLTYVDMNEPGTNFYGEAEVWAKWTEDESEYREEKRLLIHFQLPRFAPPGATVNRSWYGWWGGQLLLLPTSVLIAWEGPAKLYIHLLLEPWDPKTVDWNSQPTFPAFSSTYYFTPHVGDRYFPRYTHILVPSMGFYIYFPLWMTSDDFPDVTGFAIGIGTSFDATGFIQAGSAGLSVESPAGMSLIMDRRLWP